MLDNVGMVGQKILLVGILKLCADSHDGLFSDFRGKYTEAYEVGTRVLAYIEWKCLGAKKLCGCWSFMRAATSVEFWA